MYPLFKDFYKGQANEIGVFNVAKIDRCISTPNGSLQKYDYNKGKITTISRNMPCDITDPTRLNKNYTL